MLQPWFTALEKSEFSTWLRESAYLLAAVNVVHLLGLVVAIGALLVVDLRLLGRGMKEQPVAQLSRDAQPWLVGALIVLFVTGAIQLISTPTKAYYSPWFWLKMETLLVALIFTFTLRRRITLADEARVGPIWGKVVGLVSIVLWGVIPVSGRLIGILQ